MTDLKNSIYDKIICNARPLLIIFLLVFSISLHANETVAVHPFRSNPYNSQAVNDMADLFFDIIMRAIPNTTGAYSPYPIDLTRLPPDVPEGGFPPFICPSPSITRGANYAITGEVAVDEDFPGNFRLRVYLWNMDGNRLLGSDEISAAGREDTERMMPNFLEWVFSWIISMEPMIIYIDGEGRTIDHVTVDTMTVGGRTGGSLFSGILEQYWLHLGFHGGGGYSIWAYARNPTQANDGLNEMATLMSLNFGIRASSDLMRYLRLRTELNLVMDSGSVEGGHFSFMYLNVPLMAQFVLQFSHTEIGLYGGIDALFKLYSNGDGRGRSLDYKPTFPGFLFGLNTGLSLGPGTLFLDARFNYDGRWGKRDSYDEVYYRISNRFLLGYEWSFFAK